MNKCQHPLVSITITLPLLITPFHPIGVWATMCVEGSMQEVDLAAGEYDGGQARVRMTHHRW